MEFTHTVVGIKTDFSMFLSLSFDIGLNGKINQKLLLNKNCLFALIKTKYSFTIFSVPLRVYQLTALFISLSLDSSHSEIRVTI